MKIAGVIILYYPDESVNNNILSYFNEIDKLYIIDNSAVEQKFLLSSLIINHDKVRYFHDGKNHGIAESLNTVCKLAIEEGYLWILTMDQDSSFSYGTTKQYFTLVEHCPHIAGIAMFGVQFFGSPTSHEMCTYREASTLITSGSVVNLTTFTILGGFDANLFIDEVDLEYCLRAKENEFRIILCTSIYLNHKLGIQNTYRSFKNFNNTVRTLHTPIRIYYMVRNYLYVYSKYKSKFVTDLKVSKKGLINRLKNNLLYSNKRFEVIKFLFKGIIDFKMKKMGKLNQS